MNNTGQILDQLLQLQNKYSEEEDVENKEETTGSEPVISVNLLDWNKE